MKRIFLGITLIAAMVLGTSVYAQTSTAKTDVKKEQTSTVKKDSKKADMKSDKKMDMKTNKTTHKTTHKAKPATSTTTDKK